MNCKVCGVRITKFEYMKLNAKCFECDNARNN